MTEVTLVHGGSAAAREAAIVQQDFPAGVSAAIVEGIANDRGALHALAAASVMKVIRVAPGCPCCTGNLTMQITLNRLLREKPVRLYLSLADASHLANVRKFLQQAQYLEHLELSPDLDCG